MVLNTVTLEGRSVVLTPLSPNDVDELLEAVSADRSTFSFTLVSATREEMTDEVIRLLAERDSGLGVPFVTRLRSSGRAVGMTRFLNLRSWYGRDAPDAAEIGGTVLAASAQRTVVNTEAKYLMLCHAFDSWEVQRVDFKTDVRNERSRRAIERIGATFEGVLHHWQPSLVAGEEGRARDSAMYSITDAQWPSVSAALLSRLGTSLPQ